MSHEDNIFLFLFTSCMVEDDGTHCHLGFTLWVNMSQRFYRGKICMRSMVRCHGQTVRGASHPLQGKSFSSFCPLKQRFSILPVLLELKSGMSCESSPFNCFHSLLSISFWPGSRPLPLLGKRSGTSPGRVSVQSLGVGQRKGSLGGSKFRENHPKMSCLLYTLSCPCRRNSLKSDLLWKIPEKSLNWRCCSLDARWSSAPGWLWASLLIHSHHHNMLLSFLSGAWPASAPEL